MFWKFNLINISHIQTLLKKENVTLKELMDEDDILQECKAQTELLINYLVMPEILDEMVTLITEEPPEDCDEQIRYKYANIACEILTCDVGKVNNAIATNEEFLNKLYSFLTREKPLNPLLTSFFSKTLGLIITRYTDTLFEYLKKKEDFVPLLLKHFDTCAVMDILLRFVSCIEENDLRFSVIKWLDDQNIVQHLVKLLGSSYNEEYNANAAHTLCDIVKVSRERMMLLQDKAGDDPLLETLESKATITFLLENLFNGEKKESSIVNSISVLMALLEYKRQGGLGPQANMQNQASPQQAQPMLQKDMMQPFSKNYNNLPYGIDSTDQMSCVDLDRLRLSATNVLDAVVPFLEDFKDLLINPPPKKSIQTTIGIIETPLGASRLEVAHFHNALLSTNSPNINLELTKIGTIPILLELFFKYPWNNFLHSQVEQCIARILNNSGNESEDGSKIHPLLEQLFVECNIIQKILEVWEENEQEQDLPGKHRRGYMGHLTKIANHIAQNLENEALIKSQIQALPNHIAQNWEKFVEDILAETNKKNTVSVLNTLPITSEEDLNQGFKGAPFASEPSFQQAFSDYQIHQMTSSFVDQFGFAEDEFVDTEESLSNQINQLDHSTFHYSTEASQKSSELFEQACRERVCLADDDIWEEKEQEMNIPDRDSSDEEDAAQPEKFESVEAGPTKMEVDPDIAWSCGAPMDIAPSVDPWESNTGDTTSEQFGWADFSTASLSFANFQSASETPEAKTVTTASNVLFCNSNATAGDVVLDPMNSEPSPLLPTFEGASSSPNLEPQVNNSNFVSQHPEHSPAATISVTEEPSSPPPPLPPLQVKPSTDSVAPSVSEAGDATIQPPKSQESSFISEFESPNGPV